MKRSAPSGGYDFGPKRDYRRRVWGGISEAVGPHKSDKHILLMPSIEGDEIAVAEGKGFRRANMHVVDANPAIVAHLQRRYPGINTYGVTASRACERITDSGIVLAACNFDFTNSVGFPLLDEIHEIWEHDCIVAGTMLGLTVLRGREPSYMAAALDEVTHCLYNDRAMEETRQSFRGLTKRDVGRMTMVSGVMGLTLHRYGIYLSGKQTMLWWLGRSLGLLSGDGGLSQPLLCDPTIMGLALSAIERAGLPPEAVAKFRGYWLEHVRAFFEALADEALERGQTLDAFYEAYQEEVRSFSCER